MANNTHVLSWVEPGAVRIGGPYLNLLWVTVSLPGPSKKREGQGKPGVEETTQGRACAHFRSGHLSGTPPSQPQIPVDSLVWVG